MKYLVGKHCSVLLHDGHVHLFLEGIFVDHTVTIHLVSTVNQVQNDIDCLYVLALVGQLRFNQVVEFLVHGIRNTDADEALKRL